ncbi:MAG: hypothetical protein ACOYNY_29265 [Caldilineaceae bacterium]|jgi:hypothetical protein
MVVAIRDKQESTEADGILTTAAAMANALEYYLIEGNLYRKMYLFSVSTAIPVLGA